MSALKKDRSGRELMVATRPFARESRLLSWWHLVSTFAVLCASAGVAALAPWWPVRLVAAVVMGLTMVRAFIPFHDLHHGTIFRNSRLAKAILNLYGLLLLTPPRVWHDTHNHHHAHTAKTEGPQRGAYRLLTTEQWRLATPKQRFYYRVERHPLTLLFGYVTVFALNFGLAAFLRKPGRYWDSGVSLLLHGAVGVALLVFGGLGLYLFAFLLPFLIAHAMGAYLFYAQHTFEGVTIPDKAGWNHTRASLGASSYLKLGPVMRWFTGNIGFHHVHHLNPRIPFYRLPAAMAGVGELQDQVRVRLNPRSIVTSFRLNLWDPAAGRMVRYRAAWSSA